MQSPSAQRTGQRVGQRIGQHLRLRAAIAVALPLTLAGATLAVAGHRGAVARVRLEAATAQREQLDRALTHLAERHGRALRDVREVLRDGDPASAPAALGWVAQHYRRDVEAALADAAAGALPAAGAGEGPAVPIPDGRAQGDRQRLLRQLGRLRAAAGQVAPELEALARAVGDGDAEARAAAERALDRADRAMALIVRHTESMVHSAWSWQARGPGAAGSPGPWAWAGPDAWPWAPLAALLPVLAAALAGLALLLRPLSRLEALARTGTARPGLPASGAEAELARRLNGLGEALTAARAEACERARDTERAAQRARRSEHELALLRRTHDNLVNSLQAAIVVSDGHGVITALNRRARSLLGLTDAAVGRGIAETALFAAVASRRPDLPEAIAAALGGHGPLRLDAVALGDAARPVQLDLALVPYQDESGAARGLLWVADDVTEALATKHQLLLAERLAAVGRLSAQVAHEIRNPLSAIGLNAELLEEEFVTGLDGPRGAEARQLLHAIACEVTRLTDVTETYLHMARLPRPQLRPVDVNALLADLFVMLGEELKSHRIAVHWCLGSPAPRSHADPGQLRQALLNIVRNAREAMPAGGALEVSTAIAGDACVIAVADTGDGIPAEVLPRVFEPFYSTKAQGTGLGLSLTQQIIAEHQGEVDLAHRPGGGTRVAIHLPAVPHAAKAAAVRPD